jgi:hypothetical protein
MDKLRILLALSITAIPASAVVAIIQHFDLQRNVMLDIKIAVIFLLCTVIVGSIIEFYQLPAKVTIGKIKSIYEVPPSYELLLGDGSTYLLNPFYNEYSIQTYSRRLEIDIAGKNVGMSLDMDEVMITKKTQPIIEHWEGRITGIPYRAKILGFLE